MGHQRRRVCAVTAAEIPLTRPPELCRGPQALRRAQPCPAQHWLVGSTAAAAWGNVWVVGLAVLITRAAGPGGRQLNAFRVGDDLAIGLGVRITALQISLAGPGALLAAFVVSVAGALLMLLADYAAERVLELNEPPVGIATIIIGVPYLLALLLRAERNIGLG